MLDEKTFGGKRVIGSLDEPAPCDSCRFSERCAAEQLACDQYVMFYHARPEWRWRQAPLQPTRARFEALFNPRKGRHRGPGVATLRRRGLNKYPDNEEAVWTR